MRAPTFPAAAYYHPPYRPQTVAIRTSDVIGLFRYYLRKVAEVSPIDSWGILEVAVGAGVDVSEEEDKYLRYSYPEWAYLLDILRRMRKRDRNRLRNRLQRFVHELRAQAQHRRELVVAWERRRDRLMKAMRVADAEIKAAGGFAVSHPGWRFGVMA